MGKRKFFDISDDRYGVYVGDPIAKKTGMKMISRQKFSRSNLLIRGSEEFCNDFKELSKGDSDFPLCKISVTTSGINLHYLGDGSRKSAKIICNRVVGLKLEFEVSRANSANIERYVMEYDEDRILGKLLRIWEYIEGAERKLTMLEDGHIIALRDT